MMIGVMRGLAGLALTLGAVIAEEVASLRGHFRVDRERILRRFQTDQLGLNIAKNGFLFLDHRKWITRVEHELHVGTYRASIV